jgi:hypothetical protein
MPDVVFIARVLALLWAGFWLCFFVVESLAWHTPALVVSTGAGLGLGFVILALAAGAASRQPRDHDCRFQRTSARGRNALPEAPSCGEIRGLRPDPETLWFVSGADRYGCSLSVAFPSGPV